MVDTDQIKTAEIKDVTAIDTKDASHLTLLILQL